MKSYRVGFAGVFAVVICLGLVLAVSVVYADEERLTGRELVKVGELKGVSGTLKSEAGEWFVETGSGLVEIHLGNHEYREKLGISLEDGDQVTVNGFMKGKDMAVTI
jgi:hypothetical protein